MNEERFSRAKETSGRHFSSVMRDVSRRVQRGEALRVGDYINIDPALFATWAGTVLEGDMESLKGPESIRVTVESISYQDEAKHNPDKAIVSCGGVKREVPASLFYNYNRPPDNTHSDIVVSKMTSKDISGHEQRPGNVG